ncbi:hypothetical protein BGZ58_001944 [Dissophora ornata]|nr:hypothetical protein BGZ58_001944 [Dissophora ornata]
MNILPHKSWHVYNQKNRDKVRRDEAKAEEEEKQTNDRAIAADREHRLTVLRQRAQKRLSNNLGDEQSEQDRDQGQSTVGPPVPEDTKAVTVAAQHVNFWSDLEQHDTKSRQGNPENEAEESKGVQMSTMDRLRKERLEREKAEKAKARALLNPNYVDPSEHHRPTGAYSQQFNPQATSLAHSSHSKSFHEDKPQGRGRMERDDYNRDRNQERGRDRNGDSGWNQDRTRDHRGGVLMRHNDSTRTRPY